MLHPGSEIRKYNGRSVLGDFQGCCSGLQTIPTVGVVGTGLGSPEGASEDVHTAGQQDPGPIAAVTAAAAGGNASGCLSGLDCV